MSCWIDPHIHMISRVTDDYHRMAQCGCVAVSEPASRAGLGALIARSLYPG
jgi:predicted metal-dependent TIM-barrel fold hydrolase